MYESTTKTERVYSGRVLGLELLDVELENGSSSQREIVRHNGAIGAVCRMSDGRFLFVRQFRKAIEDYCFEIVAGTLEAGEDVRDCALREIREETGYGVRDLLRLGRIAPSPGYSDEYIHIFYAELEPNAGGQSLDDGEHVYLLPIERAEFERMVAEGEVVDAKTLAAWLLFERLMEGGGG